MNRKYLTKKNNIFYRKMKRKKTCKKGHTIKIFTNLKLAM